MEPNPLYLREERFRSSGHGGQNVNKVETGVRLRYRFADDPLLTDAQRARVRALYPGYVTDEGELLVESTRHRTQEQNRAQALAKLAAFLTRACAPEKKRVATKPTRAAKERRLAAKRRRSARKTMRQPLREES